MNENPGETPNPLNPSQGPAPTPQPAVAPTPNTTAPQPPVTQTIADPDGGPLVESLDPTGRPMQKAAENIEAPKKKKKTGLIVGIIIAAVALIGAGVAAAIVLLNMNKVDAVSMAINKLMRGEAPGNVMIDGTIDILPNDANSPISRVGVTLHSGLIMGSNINTSTAVLTFESRDGTEQSAEFNEVYAANGDLYFKVDGANSLIEGLVTPPLLDYSLEETDNLEQIETEEIVEIVPGESQITGDEDILSGGLIQIFDSIDGEWIRISTEEMGMLTDGITTNSNFSCISNLVNEINKNSNSAVELYNKYPFYTSTNENLPVTSKNNPIYKLNIDAENFANFVNSISNSIVSEDIYTCLNLEDNVSITTEDIQEVLKQMPEAYVEVDADYNFTRLYAKTETEEGAEILIDLSFSYPSNINVSEPNEYVDFSEIIQEIMLSMFDLPDAQIDEETVLIEGE